MKIKKISALEILDSRGVPTLAAYVTLENNIVGKAFVPSGASTGDNEALELRDKDPKRFFGKGVLKALRNVNEIIAPKLIGKSVTLQSEIDKALCDLDGTENKSNLGSNAILGVSLAVAHASAKAQQKELFELMPGKNQFPTPMMNIINGGAHANNSLNFQEFMIFPHGIKSMPDKLRAGSEIFHTLKKLLEEKGHNTSVGDEGGFAPNLNSHDEALEYIVKAIEKAGYRPSEDISITLDCAASEFSIHGGYLVDKKSNLSDVRSSHEQVDYLSSLLRKYPISSIEDGLDEHDWEGWQYMTKKLGEKIQIVGDDLFVTNPKFLKKGIETKAANAILIKLNQIGTLTETLDTIKLATENGFKSIISHRSAETEDTTIADLAYGTGVGQIKTGSMSRSERISKYNRLLEIYAHAG